MKRWMYFGRLVCSPLIEKTRLWRSRFRLFWVVITAAAVVCWPTGYVDPAQAVDAAFADTQWHHASFPVENFQAYTSPFGYRSDPYGNGRRFHYGLDMAAPAGSYIRSWWGGQVIEVSDDSSCGTSVVVQSGNWMHIYCHMQGHVVREGSDRYMVDAAGGLRIRQGQLVDTGTRIGRIGMTGRTTGPHLHWGLKYAENWVDPALVLRAMYSSQQAVTH